MRKTLFVIILLMLFGWIMPALAEDLPPAAPSAWKVENGAVETDRPVVIGATYRLHQYTVATLPAAPTAGDRAEIIDGASTTDCTVGGGTDIVTCRYNGSAWANVGDGQAAGSAEVQNEAYSAANFAADVTHAPTQKIFYDFWHLIDQDDDGVITDSELSLAGLTITGANQLTLGVAGATQGFIKLFSNVPDNTFYFTLFGGTEFTENVGFRPPPAMPLGLNYLLNVDVTTGQMDYTDPATFQAAATAATDSEVAALQTDDLWTISGLTIGAVHYGVFSGTTIADNQTLKTILQTLESAIEGIEVGGLASLDDLPGDDDNNTLIDNELLDGDFSARTSNFLIPSAAGLTPGATNNLVINETTGGVEFYDGAQSRTLSRGDHTHSGTYQPADVDLDSASGAGAAGNSKYWGTNVSGTVGFFDLPAGFTDTIGWDYTALSSAPGSPVAGKVYRANGAASGGWDPLTYNPSGDEDRDYFVLYTGAAYIGIVDLSGNLLIDSIPVSALDVAANVASFLGSADYAAMRSALSLVVGTNVQAYDADLTTWAGITPGSNVGTWIATPTIANWFSAVTGEGAFASTLLGYADAAAVRAGLDLERSDTGAMDTTGSFSAPITTNPYTLAAANCYGATVYYGATGEIDLPAGVDGMNAIVYNTGAFTVTIDPNASQVIVRDGTAQTGGVSITLSSGAGNYVALVFDGTQWVTKGYKGTLAEGT